MNYKKQKSEVVTEAWSAAHNQLNADFSSLKYSLLNNSQNDNLDKIKEAISNAIDAAIRTLVENTYTDQEFEEDLTLR